MALTTFDLAALFLGLSAAVGWLNLKTLRWPPAVAMLAAGLLAMGGLLGVDRLAPALGIRAAIGHVVGQVDFASTVLRVLLAFLLFAGALHVDFEALKRRAWTAAVLATVGVVISAGIVAVGLWWAAGLIGAPLSFAWALVFGVLISPTDPVAVLAILKRTSLVPDIRALIETEALFNDGVGVVLFGAALAYAVGGGQIDAAAIGGGVLIQGLGGAGLGLIAGFIATVAMRAIDDFAVEVGITLALATAVYALAQTIGVSGPIGVVVAGLLVGRHTAGERISEQTRLYTRAVWGVIDETLNGILFCLLGLEVFSLQIDQRAVEIAMLAIPVILLGRWAALAGPSALLGVIDRTIKPGLTAVMTWAGVRGGLSVAMALSLPSSRERTLILAATYAVVVFTIIVQSLSLEPLVVALGYGRRPTAQS